MRKEIDLFGSDHHPEADGDRSERTIYYKQYADLEYQIEGQRSNVKQADRLKLNLYFDPMRRSGELVWTRMLPCAPA